MANFKDLSNVTSDYLGGIKVFLESEDDLMIIGQKWFSHLQDKISFENTEPQVEQGGGGCKQVIAQVKKVIEQGKVAFGIVDRDVLLSKPDDDKEAKRYDEAFWETDDEVFLATKIFGDYIHILKRWEIENYLLRPEALQKLMVNKKLSHNVMSVDEVAKELIDKEDDFIAVSIVSTYGVYVGKQAENGFGKQGNSQDLKKEAIKHLNITQSDYLEHYNKIKAFSNQEHDSSIRWDKLSRLLDGKRVLIRLGSKNMFDGIFKDMGSERGTLADIIKNNNLIDTELTDFFDKVMRQRHRS